jgi:hypothetical protein
MAKSNKIGQDAKKQPSTPATGAGKPAAKGKGAKKK